MTHHLRTWASVYKDVESGIKSFEVRYDDRNFAVGDILVLEEWDTQAQEYTGRTCVREVTYILRDTGGYFGLQQGYVVMAIRALPE